MYSPPPPTHTHTHTHICQVTGSSPPPPQTHAYTHLKHEQSTNHISLIKQAYMLCKVTHCAGRILANTRPHACNPVFFFRALRGGNFPPKFQIHLPPPPPPPPNTNNFKQLAGCFPHFLSPQKQFSSPKLQF